jgi:hypothetical protein
MACCSWTWPSLALGGVYSYPHRPMQGLQHVACQWALHVFPVCCSVFPKQEVSAIGSTGALAVLVTSMVMAWYLVAD